MFFGKKNYRASVKTAGSYEESNTNIILGEERLSRSMSAKYSDDFEPTSPPLTGAQSSRRQSRQAAVSRARKVSEIYKLPGIEPDDGDDVVEGDANDSMWSSDILLLP